jgi:hypothetical protein
VNIKPLGKYVVTTRYIPPVKKGVLLLQDPPRWIFDVVAVGDDVHDIAEGDRVLVEEFRCSEVDVDGQHFHIVPKDRVIAILEQVDALD